MNKAVHTVAAEWIYREDNKGVRYMSNNPRAQFIKYMIYIKKPNLEIADNMKELSLWKVDVTFSLKRL